MFLGLRTVIYPVTDIERAKSWYTTVLGQEPYFDQPFYVGFEVGGFELGLDPNGRPSTSPDGPVGYWGVEDITAAFQRMGELGAGTVSPIQEVGDNIKTAVLVDPFGNTVGIIENPHFSIDKVR
jgi:predicted enzyme related to lactoylglutathione lyase